MEGEGKVPPSHFFSNSQCYKYLLDNSGTHISIVATVWLGRRDTVVNGHFGNLQLMQHTQ